MRTLHLAVSAAILAAEVATAGRALLRPNREPASRLAWVIVILAAPIAGIVVYFLLGEARMSSGRRARGRAIDQALPRPSGDRLPAGPYSAPFALAASVNDLVPTIGNRATLAADSDQAIAEMVADIDAATNSVHLCTYIWLADGNGLKVKDALMRAARRGVAVRALADALGSRRMIGSAHWADMRAAGVDVREALPVGNQLWTMIRGRVDLRNHRKQTIIDNRIAWCGSQNLADPQFRIKPRFAPWVDVFSRWEGPVARHCQYLFVSDWMGERGEDLGGLLQGEEVSAGKPGVTAQVIGTGPTIRFDAMPSCFAELIHSARSELIVTTPYFVPDEQVLMALTSAAHRGVQTVLILPQRNDSRIVAATSKSYYERLIAAGVELYEFRPGLLHAKTMVVDGAVGLIGSANLDRRSFELNFENNILFVDEGFAGVLRERQLSYVADSDRVARADVEAFTLPARLVQNVLAMLSPLL